MRHLGVPDDDLLHLSIKKELQSVNNMRNDKLCNTGEYKRFSVWLSKKQYNSIEGGLA